MTQNYKKFLLLWSASLISATGSGMTSFALGVYIYQKTGMSSMGGLLLLLGFLPGLLFTPFSGLLADRYDRRLLMMMGDGLSIIGLIIIWFSVLTLHTGDLIRGIGLGVSISSCFSSFVEPAFRATVSDLLEESEYSRASAMIQLIASARYLFSPVLAGFLLSLSGIHAILTADILTILLTLPVTYFVRREMKQVKRVSSLNWREEFQLGFRIIYQKKGIWLLVLFGILVSFCLGTIQTLMAPMILAFADESFLGFATTFSSFGLLAGGLCLSILKIENGFARILGKSLLLTGCCMIGFSARENKFSVCFFGFCLFSSLPFANTAIDYLVRTNTPQNHQGKVWGLIGIISQAGYLLSYLFTGAIVDYITQPLLIEGGLLSHSLGQFIGVSEGRGAALVIIFAGVLLGITGVILSEKTEIQKLEEQNVLETV